MFNWFIYTYYLWYIKFIHTIFLFCCAIFYFLNSFMLFVSDKINSFCFSYKYFTTVKRTVFYLRETTLSYAMPVFTKLPPLIITYKVFIQFSLYYDDSNKHGVSCTYLLFKYKEKNIHFIWLKSYHKMIVLTKKSRQYCSM